MAWELREVQELLDRVYPGGRAWEALIPEAEFDFQLNNEPGCQNVEGFAIDHEGDGVADLFLYDKGYYDYKAVTSPALASYLRPLWTPPEAGQQTAACARVPEEFTPTAFPFAGQLLPDTSGKITSIMFVADRGTDRAVAQILKQRSDLDCQVLTITDRNFMPDKMTDAEWKYYRRNGRYLPAQLAEYDMSRMSRKASASFLFSPAGFRESDFDPKSVETWIGDQFFVGVSEFGDLVAAALYDHEVATYVTPLMGQYGAVPLRSDFLVQGDDVLSSSTHLFVSADKDLTSDLNFAQVFAAGRTIVEIEPPALKGNPSLDQILTPTDEHRSGKPVVIVAEHKVSRFWPIREKEAKALDDFADQLRRKGFVVERVPYLLTTLEEEEPKLVVIVGGVSTKKHDLSYNNVLLERYLEGGQLIRRVYMPWYDKLDSQNEDAAKVYRHLGYEVVPIRNLEGTGLRGGGLRGLIKVTGREGW